MAKWVTISIVLSYTV